MRFAPGGQVLGIDLGLGLALARVRGHDLEILSALLFAAEAGIREALADVPD